jgi:hypothetical protein
MSRRTAQRFIQVAERFGDKNTKLVFSPTSVLYELAAPSTPDTVIQMVETGQIPATLPAIREAKRELHQPVITPILTEHDAALSDYRDMTDAKSAASLPLQGTENRACSYKGTK